MRPQFKHFGLIATTQLFQLGRFFTYGILFHTYCPGLIAKTNGIHQRAYLHKISPIKISHQMKRLRRLRLQTNSGSKFFFTMIRVNNFLLNCLAVIFNFCQTRVKSIKFVKIRQVSVKFGQIRQALHLPKKDCLIDIKQNTLSL